MATVSKKRKASNPLKDSNKRSRIDHPMLLPGLAQHVDDDDDHDDDDESYQGFDDFSDADDTQTVDTPITPFSPGRKKFPSQLKTHKCTYTGCEKTFNRPSRLATHLRSHADERPFTCQHEGCDKAYIDEKHLKQHVKSCHSQERPYPCQWEGCDKSFLTGTRLRRHQKGHEGQNRFRCTGYSPCQETFRKHQTLERHIRSDHLQLAPFPCLYIDPITMLPCNAGFDGSGGLRKHQERVHAILEFFCPECIIPDSVGLDGSPMHLGFATNTKLQAHINKDHATCPFCDRRCASKRELDKHMESQHSGSTLEQRKKIPCTYVGCKGSFTKKFNLDVHVRSVHEGQRYICGTFDVSKIPDLVFWDSSDGCGEAFVSKANLEDHVRTAHLGLPSSINAKRRKPQAKSDCEGLDSMTETINRRDRRIKPSAIDELLGISYDNDERRTIQCLVHGCPIKFMRDYDLRKHARNIHRLSTPELDEILGETPEGTDLVCQDKNDRNAICDRGSLEELESMNSQADIDWGLQACDVEDGSFWMGDGNGISEETQWMHDKLDVRG